MTWWTDYQSRRGQDRKTLYSNNIKNLISNKFESSTSYELVTINGISRDVRIVEESTVTRNPYKKRLLCKPSETIVVGDIVVWNSDNWICTKNDNTSSIVDVGIIEKCNNTLSFYSPTTSTLYSIPCIITDKLTLSEDENKYLTTVDNTFYLIVGSSTTTLQIKPDDIFQLGVHNYKISTVCNDISTPGLLVFKIVYSEEAQPTHTYTVTIQNSDATLNISDTLTLTTLCTDNGLIVSSPILTYLSSDTSIATVSSTGVVTAIAVGTATITVTFNSVTDTLGLTVQSAAIPDNYSVVVNGLNTVKLGSSVTLTSSVYNNGVIDNSKSVVWTVTNDDGSSNIYVSTTSYDGDSITLKATSTSSYVGKIVTVRATLSTDNTVYYDFDLTVKSLF